MSYSDEREEPVEIDGILRRVTPLAVLVELEDESVWLPKDQMMECRPDLEMCVIGDEIELTIPLWLAEKKGLA